MKVCKYFNEQTISEIRHSNLLHGLDDILCACNRIAYCLSIHDPALPLVESIVSNVCSLSDMLGLDDQLEVVFSEVTS